MALTSSSNQLTWERYWPHDTCKSSDYRLRRTDTKTTYDGKSGDEETWSLDSRVTEWTDEKHSLYLKSMEASFVNQLYSQFKVLRRGSWQKLNCERPEFQLNKTRKTRNFHAVLANPLIRNFKPKSLVPPNPPEVSDQNFIDEEINGEIASNICSSSKKMKTEEPDVSSHDQVVPLPPSKRPITENGP